MEAKEGFTRINIDELKAKKKQLESERLIENAMKQLDKEIHKSAERLANRLVTEGYDSDTFEIHTSNSIEDDKLTVHYYVVHLAETQEFKIGGES